MTTQCTERRVEITGNTYPVKEQIKALGGRWNPRAKSWSVPASRADEARALVSDAPPSRSFGARRQGLSYKEQHGRCEDAPCCGCCGPQGDGDYYGRYAYEAAMEPREDY